MSDIDDAIARGFRYRSAFDYDEEEWNDDHDERPLAALPLEPDRRRGLRQAVEQALDDARGCDGTLRETRSWARREKVPWRWLHTALEERGGFCDCEVLMNVLE